MREPLTAEERLRRLRRDQRRVRRERMARQVAAPIWQRIREVVPTVFTLAGPLRIHRLLAPAAEVVDALRDAAVFALDTAMRMHVRAGCLASGDLHAYLTDEAALQPLITAGLIAAEEEGDRVLVRPWPGPPRLFAVLVTEPPPHLTQPDGARVVTRDHLLREILGALGPRLDVVAPLF